MDQNKLNTIFLKRFIVKYAALILLFASFIPLLLSLISLYFRITKLFPFSYLIFIIMVVLALILVALFLKYKGLRLPQIDNKQDLYTYLEFFRSEKLKDYKYTEYITWFSWLLKDTFHSEEYYFEQNETDDLDSLLSKIYSFTLRNENPDSLSYAAYRREAFNELSEKIINNTYKNEDFTDFYKKEKTTESFKFKIVFEKEILIYVAVFILHIVADFFLSIENKQFDVKTLTDNFNWNSFIGNFLLTVPTDIVAIGVYRGFIKDKYVPKKKSNK